MTNAKHNPNLRIRQETPDDIPAVNQVIRLAFGQEDEVSLVENLRRSPHFDPVLSLVAELHGEIVGHILFNHITVRDGATETPALSLAPLAVHPDHQRHGIGQALARHGLNVARDLGHHVCVVLGHPTYYPKLGFIPARPLGLNDPFAERPEASMAIALVEDALEGLRGNIVYPPAFD